MRKRHDILESLSDGQVAQLVEHATENRSVGGSIPSLATSLRSRSGEGCRAEALRAKADRQRLASSGSASHASLLPSTQLNHLRPALQRGADGGAEIVELDALDQPFPDHRPRLRHHPAGAAGVAQALERFVTP